ncbi:MAG: TetR/AcrR family transcriptional regulator [Pseudomonadota bacterium]
MSTSEQIIAAADSLFYSGSIREVSVDRIAERAGVTKKTIYYHFKSKRDLFDQVMLRKADTLNALRLKALEAVERRHPDDAPTVEEIIGAFTHPLLELLAEDHEEWQRYFQLIAQINSSSEWGGELMTRYFDPLVSRFIEALRKALPGCSDEDLYWSYHFLSGALTLTFAETGRIDNLSGGVCRSSDMHSINERMPSFLAAGFRALANKSRD